MVDTQAIDYSGISIATYMEITIIMECQISRDIQSYNSTNCFSCPSILSIVHISQAIDNECITLLAHTVLLSTLSNNSTGYF